MAYYYPYQNYYQPQQIMQPQSPSLYGKIVDGVETVRANDVPIGVSAVFPKADGSCVYIKSWTNEGTTRIDEYRKFETKSENYADKLDNIQNLISELNSKMDAMSSAKRRKAGETSES